MTSTAEYETLIDQARDNGNKEWFGIQFENGTPLRNGKPVPTDPLQWTKLENYVFHHFYFRPGSEIVTRLGGEWPVWSEGRVDHVTEEPETRLDGVETVVNMLKSGWDIIKSGAPSAEIKTARADAVPKVDDWQNLTGTAPEPKSTTWGFSGYNLFGMTLYDLQINLLWNYNAKYKDKGLYIPNCWFDVPKCYVGWSWNASLSVAFQNPINTNTAEDPHAGLPLTISGSAWNWFQHKTLQKSFTTLGNGTYY